MNRGALSEIDLQAIAHNLKEVKRVTKGLPVIAVVKADAYGHGGVEVSRVFEKQGVHSLATAFIGEAQRLREAGIRIPILVLFDCTDIKSFFSYNLIPVIHDLRTLKAFSKEAGKRECTIDVHIKVDTGMGRMGFTSEKDALKVVQFSNINITGLMSHFSEADLSDIGYAQMQLNKFLEVKTCFNKKGLRPLCHMANSAATVNLRDSHLDAVRPGLMLYGCSPFKGHMEGMKGIHLKAPHTVFTTVLALRELKKGQPVSYGRTFITTRKTLAGVLSVGYADGYPRALSNKGYVILKGKLASVIGRVCMDLIVVDVTDIRGVREGDKAILLGSEGKITISAWELAEKAGTIPYEILTSLSGRAEKIYVR